MPVLQDDAAETAMDRHLTVALVIDQPQLSELVHEMTDPRPGSADHLGQAFLMDSGQ